MDILDAIRQRRAVREYKTDPVQRSLLRDLVEAANWAPSAMNGQPWHFVVVTNRTLLDRISEEAKRWSLDHDSGGDAQLRALLKDSNFHILHHAPALVVIVTPVPVKWNRESCALAAQNLMLAATAYGLGSCWIGLAENFLESEAGHQLLRLPASDHIVAPVAIGYPRGLLQPVPRRPPHITWLDEENIFTEEVVGGEPELGRGFYGSLVHP